MNESQKSGLLRKEHRGDATRCTSRPTLSAFNGCTNAWHVTCDAVGGTSHKPPIASGATDLWSIQVSTSVLAFLTPGWNWFDRMSMGFVSASSLGGICSADPEWSICGV